MAAPKNTPAETPSDAPAEATPDAQPELPVVDAAEQARLAGEEAAQAAAVDAAEAKVAAAEAERDAALELAANVGGEFLTAEQRAAHIAALHAEYAFTTARGSDRADAVARELARLGETASEKRGA